MPTEGLSEENLALLEREGWSTGNLSPEMQAEFNYLLDAARAEGSDPPGGGGEEDYRGSLRSAPGSTSHRTDGAGTSLLDGKLGNTPTREVLRFAADMLDEAAQRLGGLVDMPVIANKLRELANKGADRG